MLLYKILTQFETVPHEMASYWQISGVNFGNFVESLVKIFLYAQNTAFHVVTDSHLPLTCTRSFLSELVFDVYSWGIFGDILP